MTSRSFFILVLLVPILATAQDFGTVRLKGSDKYACDTDNQVSEFSIFNSGNGDVEILTALSAAELSALRRSTRRALKRTKKQLKKAKGKKRKRKLRNKKKDLKNLQAAISNCINGQLFVRACDVIEGGFSTNEITANIINGDVCDPSSNSPFVLLEMLDNNNNFAGRCTGIAVREDTFITAAHCLYNEDTNTIFSRINVTSSLGSVVSVDHVPVSSYSFASGLGNERFDAAVLYTSAIEGIATARIIPADQELVAGERGVIGGYGETGGPLVGRLLAGFMYIDSATPSLITGRWDGLAGTSDTCEGDSGGPILVKRNDTWYVAGMLSAGLDPDCKTGDIVTFASLLDPQMRSELAELVYFDLPDGTDFP